MEAKKTVEHTRLGEYEVIKNHVIDVKNVDVNTLNELIDLCEIADDGEDAYMRFGMAFDFDWEPAFFEVTKFIKGVRQCLAEEQDSEVAERFEAFLLSLEQYVGYTIDLA